MDDQLITFKGIYEDGNIILSSPYQLKGKFHILITFLEPLTEALSNDRENSAKQQRELLLLQMHISRRELSIINQVAKGLKNREIASSLEIGEGTVRNYISGLLSKLKVKSRMELANKAIELGLVEKE